MIKSFFEKIADPKNNDLNIIVEMSGNHQNSLSKAIEFVKAAILNGADIVKFQVYRPDTITLKSSFADFAIEKKNPWSKYNNLYNLYDKAHTPWSWIEELVKICENNNQPWFASVFDHSSVDFLQKLNCPAYKIASPEITDIPLIEKVSLTKKPIILSTGLAKLSDIQLAVKTIKKKHSKFIILKCTSDYPADYRNLNLNSIQTIKKIFKCSVGFSDHTIGDLAAQVSVALGATLIEKHFILDGDRKSIDRHFSMKISQIGDFKKKLKETRECLGEKKIMLSKNANLNGRRSLYIVNDILPGECFTHKNTKSIRPSFGLHPKYFSSIIGKKAKKKIEAGTRVTKKLIENLKKI